MQPSWLSMSLTSFSTSYDHVESCLGYVDTSSKPTSFSVADLSLSNLTLVDVVVWLNISLFAGMESSDAYKNRNQLGGNDKLYELVHLTSAPV